MKINLISLILLLFTLNVFSQDDRLDEFSFEEQSFDEKIMYFGIGGGYTGSFFITDMSDLNQFLENNDYGLEEIPDNLYHHGLELMSSTVIIPNTRIGFFRYSGASEVSTNIDFNGQNYKRRAEYKNFMTGVPLEYVFMPFKSFAIVPGVAVGYGNTEIDLTQTPNEIDFGNLESTNIDGSFFHQISTPYWFAMPRLNIEYAFTQFTVIKLSGFYLTSFAQDWKFNNEAALQQIPDGLDASGYAVQIGIYVGLFNY